MRAAIRLLTLVCLLWCTLGVAEPAAAHDDSTAQHVTIGADHAGESPDAPAAPEPGGHHHCPVAPDAPPAGAAAPVALAADVPLAGRSPALASLTRAPPLQPPAA